MIVVFKLDDSGSYNEIQRLSDSDGAESDEFGHSVAISADGQYIVGGADAYDDHRGKAVIFKLFNDRYIQIKTILDSYGYANNYFAFSVAISANGNYIVSGAHKDSEDGDTDVGSISVFKLFEDETKSFVSPQGLLTNESEAFGHSIDMTSDGKYIVVGAPFNDGFNVESGIVYLLERNSSNTNYIFIQSFTYNFIDYYNPSINDNTGGYEGIRDVFTDLAFQIGYSVAISDDGNTVVVGAPQHDYGYRRAGAFIVFEKNHENIFEKQGLYMRRIDDGSIAGRNMPIPYDNFVWSVAMTPDAII